jgi:hypothetical protein
MRNRLQLSFLALLGLALSIPPARAQLQSDAALGGFHTSVPVSAFARPAAWLDPQRLQVTAEVMVGTGFGGRGMNGLQVTRLNYRIADPLAVQVSIGNAFGSSMAGGAGSFFLEGFDVSYQPFRSLLVQVHYKDVRSPLQLSRPGTDPWRY